MKKQLQIILCAFEKVSKQILIQKTVLLLFILSACIHTSHGQIMLTELGSSYTQDFNTLISTGNETWENNTTLTGWYVTNTAYAADNGSTASSKVFSYGSTGSSDRALGAFAISSTVRFGVRLKNNTGRTITSFRISYKGEQWRLGTATSGLATTLDFHYKIGTNLTDLTADNWVATNSLTFTAPQQPTGSTASAIDGNATGNFTNKTATINVSVANGQEIFLRWSKNGATGSHGLAIDDLEIVPINDSPDEPEVTCSPTSLAFGSILIGETSTRTITVEKSNLTGNLALAMQSGGATSIFSVTPASLPQANGTSTVTVSFTPIAAMTYSDVLIISGGGLATSVRVTLSGSGAAPQTHTITSSVNGGNGTITPSGTTTVTHGGTQTYSIVSSSGYIISQVLVDGVNNPTAVSTGSYTFTNVAGNHTIEAFFTVQTEWQYTVGYTHGNQNSLFHSSDIPIRATAIGSHDNTGNLRNPHHTQTIYTADKLQPIAGSRITKISYRVAADGLVPASHNWQATGVIKLMSTTTTNVRHNFVDISSVTPVSVCHGEFKYTNHVMEFTLETPFDYLGGNLLIDIEKTTGTGIDDPNTVFFEGGSSCYTENPNDNAWMNNPDNFISRYHVYLNANEMSQNSICRFPEITFTYTPVESHVITASATAGGTITPSGQVSVVAGGNQTFTFAPNANYSISQVLIDGVSNPAAANAGSYTFTNVTTNHRIEASFQPNSGGIADPSSMNIAIYAHQNRVYIVNEKQIPFKSLQLIDLLGRVVYDTKNSGSAMFTVDVPEGLYLVKLISENGDVIGTKVYIQR